MDHDHPVTKCEHRAQTLPEGVDSNDRAVPKYRHGAERAAPLRHALIGGAGFVEWPLSCSVSWEQQWGRRSVVSAAANVKMLRFTDGQL
jgi:hypothetical protein